MEPQHVCHLIECCNTYFMWGDCTILEVEGDTYKHLLKDAMHIIPMGSCVIYVSLSLDNMTMSVFWGIKACVLVK